MKMKKHIITTSVLLAAFLVVLGIAVMGTFVSAHAGDISVYTDGPWLMFSFEAAGIDAKGCAPADPVGLNKCYRIAALCEGQSSGDAREPGANNADVHRFGPFEFRVIGNFINRREIVRAGVFLSLVS